MVTHLSSPKQPQPERLKDWYPYYAGYTASFAEGVIDSELAEATSIVDPWNGSGTTTAVSLGRGKTCLGVDINPALTVVARARLTPKTIAESLLPIGADIVAAADTVTPSSRRDEPLAKWLRSPAVRDLRKLQRAIHIVTSPSEMLEGDLASRPEQAASQMPLITAFFYAALFAVSRDVLKSFRASNPTWLRYPETTAHRIQPSASTIGTAFLGRVRYLSERLTLGPEHHADQADLRTGRAQDVLQDAGGYSACFSSPPYATRIDYIKGSLPELAILGLNDAQVDSLRRLSTGTPVVRDAPSHGPQQLPDAALKLIEQVASHNSHGSASYYGPWLQNYLMQLDGTLGSIDRCVNKSGKIALVVQDSYYKDIRIDLQGLIVDSLVARGRRLDRRQDFPVRHSMSKINSKAQNHLRNRVNTESLLVLI